MVKIYKFMAEEGENQFGAEVFKLPVEAARQRRLDTSPLTEDELEQAVDYYETVYQQRSEGPQLEGLSGESLRGALSDPATVALEISTPNGHVVWPLLSPVSHNEEYRPEFFDEHLGGGMADCTYYFSDPGEVLDQADLKGLGVGGAVIACDYQEGKGEASRDRLIRLMSKHDIAMRDIFDDLPDSERPRVLHFAAKTHIQNAEGRPTRYDLQAVFDEMVAAGKAERYPHEGATILSPKDIIDNKAGLADDLWAMYESQFEDLVEDHPSMQMQSRGSLLGMLADDDTLGSEYFVDGRVNGLCFFVRNIKKCEWLDPEYYSKHFPGENVVYFPGIVVNKAVEGGGLSLAMVRQFANVVTEANLDNVVVFQCTNISAQYVPRLVEAGIKSTRNVGVSSVEPLASYRYDVFESNPSGRRDFA